MLIKVLGQAVNVSQIENPTLRSIFASEAEPEQSGSPTSWTNWQDYQNWMQQDRPQYQNWQNWGQASGSLTGSPNICEPDMVGASDSGSAY